VIGNSLSRGLHASALEKTYRALLQRWLGVPVRRIHGCTIRAALQSIEGQEEWPHVVFIEVGINNLVYKKNQEVCPFTEYERFSEEYRLLVQTLRAHGVRVIAGTIPWSGWTVEEKVVWDRVQQFNYAIKGSGADVVADLWAAALFKEDQPLQS
jgi:hypothetical protein